MFALHFVRGMHPELFQENVSNIEGRKSWNYERFNNRQGFS